MAPRISNAARSALALFFAAACVACQSPRRERDESPPAETAQPAILQERFPDGPLVIAKTPPTAAQRQRDYRLFNEYLGAAVGHPVIVEISSTYGQAIDTVVEGRAQFALLSPLAYVEAKEREPRLQLLASILREGQTQYLAYITTRQGSPVRALTDLRGKRFAFGDPSSTSATLFPKAMLLDVGIDPAKDLAATESWTDHRQILERVQLGLVDAGAISSTTLRHVEAGSPARGVRVIAKSEPIPFDAFVAHPAVAAAVVGNMRAALLQLSTRTKAGRKILRGLLLTAGFIAAEDARYDSIRRVRARLAATQH